MKLPIDDSRPDVLQALASLGPGERLVLSAPTGSGKSTRLPVWCWEQGLGPVLVVEPRRLACRTLATWVSAALGQEVGQRVGYSVRFEQRSGHHTEILFVTPGVARRFLSEGALSRFATVIFDEFHERGWETDTVMAALAAASGPQRLLLMSATLTAERLASVYGATRLESFGRSYPVEISYLGAPELTVPSTFRLVDRVCRAIEEHWDSNGGTLVFLPGLASMREVKQRLPRLPIRLLHGAFAKNEQDHAFSDKAPRIVLATNVAESSLTLPGITMVIDSGLEKRPIHQSGYVALSTVPISIASADQRAGRAGRTLPGRCLRLWDEKARLEAYRPPDLERMELDDLLLFLAGLPLGLATPLAWMDPPPTFAWDRALQRLKEAGLVDDDGLATPLGQQVGRLPLETEWARILALAPFEMKADLCDLYALSSGRRGMMLAHADSEQVERRKTELGLDPWRRSLSLMRLAEPRRHGLEPEAWQEARRLADDLRLALAVPASERATPHPELASFLARHWPLRHFVRRQNREAWGNGQVECRMGRSEEIAEECQAVLFLQVQPVLARGLKVELRGSWALPSSFAVLRQAGFGQPELSKIRLREGRVTAQVAWMFAGRILAQEEEELAGCPLRQALTRLAAQGSWKGEIWQAWEEHAFYAGLRSRLDGQDLSCDTSVQFERHLSELGVETCQDLTLLEDADLLPPPTDEALKKAYPRLYFYGGVAYDVSYRPESRRVLLRWRSGPRGASLKVQHLPRWNGWAVELEERGRLTPLR